MTRTVLLEESAMAVTVTTPQMPTRFLDNDREGEEIEKGFCGRLLNNEDEDIGGW